jgi:hypothetical protein
MKKYRVIKIGILYLILTFAVLLQVNAQPKNEINKTLPFYVNMNGVELTEVQYSNLSKLFDESTLKTLTKEQLDLFASDPTLQRGPEYSQYIRTDMFLDYFGNIISSIHTEVTEQEALDYIANPPVILNWSYPTHQTAMKRLTISINFGLSIKSVTLTNTWLSMPVVRSHDVLAIRMSGTSLTLSGANPISGYLRHNGNIIQNYNQNHSNVRRVNAGVGISMKLPTGGTSMVHGMTVTVINNNDPFDAWGSFQHATSTVTLAQSRVYNLNNNGLGNVIDFTNSSTRAKYDGMRGVRCRMSINNFWSCN